MSQVSFEFSQPTPKKLKLHEDISFHSSLPTVKSNETAPNFDESSSKRDSTEEPDNFDRRFDIDEIEPLTGSSIYKIYQCNPKNPDSEKQVHECLNFVIQEYNRLMYPNSELVDAKIVKANRCCVSLNHRYYITFHALEKISGKSDTYQTDVIYDPEYLDFSFIRRKGTNKAFLYPLNLVDQKEIDRIEKCAKAAIGIYHHIQPEKPRHEFVKTMRAVQDSMRLPTYRICFKARNTESVQIGTYYAEVMYSWEYDNTNVTCIVPEDEMKDDEFLSFMVKELLEPH